MKKLLFGLVATLGGAVLIIWGFDSDFWTRGCTEEIANATNFVFDNACQDSAFGHQLGLTMLGFGVLAFGVSRINGYIRGR